MRFEILGDITDVETFATGSGIREIARLQRIYGCGRWRKRNGIAVFAWRMVLSTLLSCIGTKPPVIGRRELKIKHLL